MVSQSDLLPIRMPTRGAVSAIAETFHHRKHKKHKRGSATSSHPVDVESIHEALGSCRRAVERNAGIRAASPIGRANEAGGPVHAIHARKWIACDPARG